MHVVVIGAGLLGTCTAWFLRKNGFDVTVLERREGAGLEASWGNGGYCQSGYPEPWNQPGIHRMLLPAWRATWREPPLEAAMLVRTRALAGMLGWGPRFLRNSAESRFRHSLLANRRLAGYSQQVLREIERELGLDCALHANGSLWLFREQQSLDQYAAAVEFLSRAGTRFEALDRAGLTGREPSLAPVREQLAGALFFPDELGADPHRFCSGLACAAAAAGVVFEYGHEVRELYPHQGGVRIETNHGEFEADRLVLAAGVHSRRLGRQLGIRLPLQPAKGYSISIPMDGWARRPSRVIADMSLHAGVNPMGGFLRVAGTAEFAGFDEGVSQNRTDSLLLMVEKIFPEFAAVMDRESCQPWAGLRPLSVDGMPYVGESGVEHVFLNTGHGGLGWTQAGGSAKALADLIAGAGPAIDLRPYALPRRAAA